MNFENLDNLRPVKGYKFKGWDWSEIGHALGYETPDTIEGEAMLLSWTHMIIHLEMEIGFYGGQRGKVVKPIRRYVKKLIQTDHGYCSPLWAGLSLIEDDWTFLKYVDCLLEAMWT